MDSGGRRRKDRVRQARTCSLSRSSGISPDMVFIKIELANGQQNRL